MKTIEHFIDQQAAAEQEFIESFHREHRSFENPLVTVNPYGIAPLTAVIAFFYGGEGECEHYGERDGSQRRYRKSISGGV